jgi:hypothetical protein
MSSELCLYGLNVSPDVATFVAIGHVVTRER